ncbi:twin-arginine translocase subunit TatC [Adhaeretor mobilis]|uniref:Sec-independent protein translocase protein TatC n=1 Tax=Adhaeretor mobilis TaxID=1930276 RepID=A0A517MZ78_9BACT|nr:twin-arginine translocase subunit TatC [Adhaeretor mobilis]QDT00193.1 Sec-independent protein translocase protein TatCy [Adhaeretor mobilis]
MPKPSEPTDPSQPADEQRADSKGPQVTEAFDHTKMSFGQHLEELRSALFKAILALAAGTVFGLFIGWDIVAYIQTPLKEALVEHYREQSEVKELERLEQLKADGEAVPDDLDAAAGEFAERGLSPLEYWLDPREILPELAKRFPEAIDLGALPATDERIAEERAAEQPAAEQPLIPSRDDLIRLRLYRSVEDDPRVRVIGLQAHEPFMVYIKASLVAGAMFASPFIFYFIWDFVAAGLYRHERKYIYLYLPFSLGLFLAGAALAFYVAFDYVLAFLFKFYAWTETDPSMQLSEWMSFVLLLPLGFGISFQLPLVMLLLERIGVFTVETYLSKWRIAILVIAVLSMFLTPADPQSMVVMGVPLVALYFAGIALCRYMPGRRESTRSES